MNENELIETVKHIKLGIKEVFYFNYDGEPLPLRPISSFELDDSVHRTLGSISSSMANLVIKFRLEILEPSEHTFEWLPDDLAELQKYYDGMSYWVVYHSMKDFQDQEFVNPIQVKGLFQPKGIEIVRKMNYIHEIADMIIGQSTRPKEVIKEILSTDEGKEVAYIVYYLKQPLGDVSELTRLQRDYLLYSKGEITEIKGSTTKSGTTRKLNKYSVSNEKVKLGDFLKGVRE